jgi:hypothetical protein
MVSDGTTMTSISSYYRDYLKPLGLLLLCLSVLVLFGSWGKPIWTDEFLYFAIGAHSSTAEAVETIYRITGPIRPGQTGFYILLDYWLLKIFGADLLALRLPSLLSTLWVLLSGFIILRLRSFSWAWLYLLVLSAMGQSTFIYFTAEARTYMPLAAASVGVLAYYLVPVDARHGVLITLFGWISVFWGVLMHPYFCLYWAVLWLYAYGYQCWQRNLVFGFQSALVHVNLVLLILGSLVFFAVAELTYLKANLARNLDPFQWVRIDIYLPVFLNHSHFEFIRPLGGVFIAGGTTLLVFLFRFLKEDTRQKLRPLIPPSVLIMTAMALSVILSLISYFNDYWILQRQWVASMAIVTIAVVWLIAEISRIAAHSRPKAGKILYPVFLLYVMIMLVPGIRDSYQRLNNYWSTPDISADQVFSQFEPVYIPQKQSEWVELADLNTRAGGEVWPVFRHYYRERESRLLERENRLQ